MSASENTPPTEELPIAAIQNTESERERWAMENAEFLTAYNARIEKGDISFAEFRGLS